MDVFKHDRRASGAVLFAILLVGGGVAFFSGGSASDRRQGAGGDLAALEKAIADGQADGATWARYAGLLSERGSHRQAAEAYRQALETDPVNRELLFQRGSTLARAGDADALFACLREYCDNDPRLTYDLLKRPEFKSYLAKERFRKIQEEALSQYLD